MTSITKDNDMSSGNIFNGASFFLLQRIPSRTHFIDQVRSHGGRVVLHEAAADYVIADHLRKDSPAGSTSWKFIEECIKANSIVDPKEYRAGSEHGAARVVGSAAPVKPTRTPFNEEEDRILWEWVERAKLNGAAVKGNEIYKQLEAVNSRHSWQAWRHRYVKQLLNNPPTTASVMVAANAPPTPPPAVRISPELRPDEKSHEPLQRETAPQKEHVATRVSSEISGKDTTGLGKVPSASKLESVQDQHRNNKRVAPVEVDSGPQQKRKLVSDEIEKGGSDHQEGQKKRTDAIGHWPKEKLLEPALFKNPDSDSIEHVSEIMVSKRDPISRPGTISPDMKDLKADQYMSPARQLSNTPSRMTMQRDVIQTVLQPGKPLTEANLAWQQAQQREKPMRGIDLLEDDPMDDQTAFAEYLENLQRQSAANRLSKLAFQASPSRRTQDSIVNKSLSKDVYGSDHQLLGTHVDDVSNASIEGRPRYDQHTTMVEIGPEYLVHETNQDDDWQDGSNLNGESKSPSKYNTDENPRSLSSVNELRDPRKSVKAEQEIVEISSTSSHSSDDDSEEEMIDQPAPPQQVAAVQRPLETQDIMNLDIPSPDLAVPPPPEFPYDEDDDDIPPLPAPMFDPSSSSPLPPNPQPTQSSPLPQPNLRAWVSSMLARGYLHSSIYKALMATSQDVDLAEVVLLEERSGRGLPDEIPGIWSEEEDRALEYGGRGELERLELKHGWAICEERWRFLAAEREENE